MNKILIVIMLLIGSGLNAQSNLFPLTCDAVKILETPSVIYAGKDNSGSKSGFCPDPCLAQYIVTHYPASLGAADLEITQDFSAIENGLCKIYQCTTLRPCDFTGCILSFKNVGIFTYELTSYGYPGLNRLIFPGQTYTHLFDQYKCGWDQYFEIREQSTGFAVYTVYLTCGVCRNLE